jgi:hypothetical protein
MQSHFLTAALAALSLAGCATVPAEGEGRAPSDTCRVEPGQRFISERATAESGAAIMRATDSVRLRWVPPDTAVTMEYGLGRVTVSYDRDYRITAVSCS